jgi:hypothetical protein
VRHDTKTQHCGRWRDSESSLGSPEFLRLGRAGRRSFRCELAEIERIVAHFNPTYNLPLPSTTSSSDMHVATISFGVGTDSLLLVLDIGDPLISSIASSKATDKLKGKYGN